MTQVYPIRLVRLITGETLVTGIGESGKNNYVLERPMLLLTMEVEDESNQSSDRNQVSVAFKDWIDFTTDDYIFVKKEIVVCMVKPVRGIISDYMQAKMSSDIMDDMHERDNQPMSVDDLASDKDDGGLAEPDRHIDEFPGWGGDPDLT